MRLQDREPVCKKRQWHLEIEGYARHPQGRGNGGSFPPSYAVSECCPVKYWQWFRVLGSVCQNTSIFTLTDSLKDSGLKFI